MKYSDIAPDLFDNGWRNILPLTHAKGTYVKWGQMQHKPMTEATLDYFMKKYGNAPRLGLVHGAVHDIVSVDIDVEDEKSNHAIMDLAEQHLPPTDFVRVGKPPKCLLLYRGQVKSQKPHPIEIFGSSGQIAAFGDHPKTMRPYQWIHDASPLDASPDDLPLVTQAQIDTFLSHCFRNIRPKTASGSHVEWSRDDVAAAERRVGGVDACARQIRDMLPGTRYPTVLRVVGYLVNEGATTDEAATFVDEWFPNAHRTEEFRNVYSVALKVAETAVEKWSNTEWELEDE